jgi:hypothetical protein
MRSIRGLEDERERAKGKESEERSAENEEKNGSRRRRVGKRNEPDMGFEVLFDGSLLEDVSKESRDIGEAEERASGHQARHVGRANTKSTWNRQTDRKGDE